MMQVAYRRAAKSSAMTRNWLRAGVRWPAATEVSNQRRQPTGFCELSEQECGCWVTATDPVGRFISKVEEVGSADVCAAAADLPFRSCSFDLAVAYNVLMDVQDVPAALSEIRRVLRLTGTVMISFGRVVKRTGGGSRSKSHPMKALVLSLLPLAFLAPEIVEAIAAGRQPPGLTAHCLIRTVDLPIAWTAQKRCSASANRGRAPNRTANS
jgi:SAM-dependent methyltransferase